MPTQVRAKYCDCLCLIGISAGFRDCAPLRAEPANSSLLSQPLQDGDIVTVPDLRPNETSKPTNQKHTFKKLSAPPVSIRFVHGSPNVHYLQDAEVLFLQISNHQTTRGGHQDEGQFPAGFGFDPLGHADPDTFKVEVVDPRAGSPVNVCLEALRQVALANGVTSHDTFPAALRAGRSLDPLQCEIVSSGVAFRSNYLRLVTDETDKAAVADQTLLVTDMTDDGDAAVEILQQAVRATYVLQRCPGSPAPCQVSVIRPVGRTADSRKPRKRIRMAVHILTTAPGAAGVVTPAQADRRITRWVRRTYAQAGFAPILVQPTGVVDPQDNLVAIGDPHGPTAAGDGQMGFRITAAGQASQIIGPIATVRGRTPEATAQDLAGRVAAPYVATVSRNPAGFGDPVGNRSADIIVTVPNGVVIIDQELSTDSRQTLTIGRPNPVNLAGFSNDFLIGSSQQRALLKTYDTGDDRVDVFVVQAIDSGDRGQAMMHGVTIDPSRPAVDRVRFSVFVNQASMDASDNDFVNLAHEMGHVLMDMIHATGNRSQFQLMMGRGTDFLVAENHSKRIKELGQQFDTPAGLHRQIDRIPLMARAIVTDF